MEKTKYFSYKNNKLAKGCELCLKGKKMVLFVTGVCSNNCYFCPVSEEKFKKDVIFANEMPIEKITDIIKEAKLCSSSGCGITGGDPLARLDRTLKTIEILKEEFGTNFHIHLYTPLANVSNEVIETLERAGLDEIRFHPDLDDSSLWNKIKIPTKMSKGVEIPVIPNKKKETIKLIEFISGVVDFLNLNELEIADAKHNKLAELGFEPKSDLSYAVKGSEELALELLNKYPKMNIHYCTTKLKDSVQLMNRIELRAKNVKKPYDKLNGATLIRGAIYLKELTPDFGFQKKLLNVNKEKTIEKLKEAKEKLSKHFKNLDIDGNKMRILTSKQEIKQKAKVVRKLGFIPYVTEELATFDQFEIESEEL
ncbi:MAG: radical SAM protein [archaeon]